MLTISLDAQYRFDVWTTDNGLPQNSVMDILQTRDGFLWLATFDALVRYDGVQFKIFNTGNSKGIKGTRFRQLFEARDGVLWIATENNGLVKYQSGEFRTFTTRDGLRKNDVGEIREDEAGNIYAWNSDGMTRLENERFVAAASPQDGNTAVPSPGWYIDRNGLNILENEQVARTLPFDGGRNAEAIQENLQNSFGWVVTDKGKSKRLIENQKLVKIDYATDSFVTIRVLDRSGNLWFGSGGAGLFRFKDGELFNYTTEDGLPSDEIHALIEDREGNIWIGTSKGLVRVTERLMNAFSTRDGLAADNVYPIFQDSAGAIWIGSWSGLTRYANGVFANVGERFDLAGALTRSIYEDREGNLWVGTFDTGLRKISGGRVTDYSAEFKLFGTINAIFQDRAGTLWFGTEKGLIKKLADDSFVRYAMPEGLSGNTVNVIFEDKRGALWIGTEQGLTELRDGVFKTYGEAEGLSGYIVRAIYEDADGFLWIGTYDGGLNRLKDGKFTRITTNEGLFNNGVFAILEDRRGEFWMTSNLGVYRANRQELNNFADGKIAQITSVSYGKPDGMLETECNGGGQPAGIAARDGRFWFPTQKGVVVFNPDAVKIIAEPPPLQIEDVVVDNAPTTFDGELRVPPDKENFEISYTGLSFILPEQIRFRYKLEGLNQDWVEAGTRRTAYFSYLPPGEYVFSVTAANRDGVWNPEPARLKIVVVPAYYQTIWFRVLLLLGVIGIGVFLYTRRIWALERANETQKVFSAQLIESQETERKRIAAELHDGLSQNLVVIKNRILLARRTIENHEKTVEQLDEISSATDEAIDEVSEISYNLRPYQLDKLGLTKAIESMLRKVSTATGIKFAAEIDDLTDVFAPEAEINFYRIVQECVNNIVKHSGASEASVKARKTKQTLRLVVTDNGRGFELDAAKPAQKSGGFGFIGIAERARILGGKYQIQSQPNSGTTVTLEIGLGQPKTN